MTDTQLAILRSKQISTLERDRTGFSTVMSEQAPVPSKIRLLEICRGLNHTSKTPPLNHEFDHTLSVQGTCARTDASEGHGGGRRNLRADAGEKNAGKELLPTRSRFLDLTWGASLVR
jgi:hypothetical protein